MKKLIVLKATQNHGKTRTLLDLIHRIKIDVSFSVLIDEPYYNPSDRFLIAANSGKRIAVITEGDAETYEQIETSLNRCRTLDVDVIFSASWTNGYVYNLLCEFAEKNDYCIIETSPNFCTNKNDTLISRLNDRMAQMLFSFIGI